MSDLTADEQGRIREAWNRADRLLRVDPLLAVMDDLIAARLAKVTAERRLWYDRAGDALAALRKAEAENARLRDTIARVEALAASWYGVHDGLAGDLRAALAGGDS